MNTLLPDLIDTTADLTVEIRSSDGSSSELYQTGEECIRKTLQSLTSPRLFTHPQVVLAAGRGVQAISCRSIDMIMARTAARAPLIFPLIFPAGLLDLLEVKNEGADGDTSSGADQTPDGAARLSPLLSYLEIQTAGGWNVGLRALATARDFSPPECRPADQIRSLPLIPFRLLGGGIGLINPHNITDVSIRPVAAPLPVELLRPNPYRF